MKNALSTRMELWKDYRKEIEENIALQESVRNSNEKLQILYNRLQKVFPDYESKYSSKLHSFKINLKKIGEPPKYSTQKIQEIIENINLIETENLKKVIKFDDLDFSTKVLDNIIKMLNQGVNKQKLSDKNISNQTEIIVKKPQKVFVEKRSYPKFSVAIDGPSGAGKSTIARKIANKWRLFYLNTGLVYRAIALKAFLNKINYKDEQILHKILLPNMIKLHLDESVELDGKDVTLEVRADNISQIASIVSTFPSVRKYALEIQQHYVKKGGVIAEGRDTTFRVLPHADIKIYLDTLPEVRAQRRVNQNAELGYNTNYDEILEEIIERDERDKNRQIDPLHQTNEAIYIDASYLSVDDVVEKINQIINQKLHV